MVGRRPLRRPGPTLLLMCIRRLIWNPLTPTLSRRERGNGSPMPRIAFLLLLSALPSATDAAETVYDVVVYGGTSGGVAAAVQAARMGKTVVLIEPGTAPRRADHRRPGRNRHRQQAGHRRHRPRVLSAASTSITHEDTAWTRETRDKYRARAGTRHRRRHDVDLRAARGRSDLHATCWPRPGCRGLGPAVGLEIGRPETRARGSWPSDGVGPAVRRADVHRRHLRRRPDGHGGRLVRRRPRGQRHLRRNAQRRPDAATPSTTSSSSRVDPYVTPGDPASGLLPGVHAGGPGEEGEADRRVQAYNFRMCLTDVPENRVPLAQARRATIRSCYELLLRNFEAGDQRHPWQPGPMPNRKTDTNNNCAVSTDDIGMNYDYPDGDYATRAEDRPRARRVPAGPDVDPGQRSPRARAGPQRGPARWGLAKDEFTDNGNWPHAALRPRGPADDRRLRDDRAQLPRPRGAPRIPWAWRPTAWIRTTRSDTSTPQGHVRNEGDVQVGGFPPYPISYRAIVPKAGGVHQSAGARLPVGQSHIAYGSIRMEPVFMVLGQSAATAAVQAIDENADVQAIDVVCLQKRLLAGGQILQWSPSPEEEGRITHLEGTPCGVPGAGKGVVQLSVAALQL